MKELYEPGVKAFYLDGTFAHKMRFRIPRELNASNTMFVCIGTDRSTGDALGPLVGSMLKRAGLNVIGTMDSPVHAENLVRELAKLPDDHTIIGIDACLGNHSLVGTLAFGAGPVRPGAVVGKDLPPVGEYHITGVVNVGGFMEYFVLQNTRLHVVMQMAEAIASAIIQRFAATLQVAATGEESEDDSYTALAF